MSGDQTLLDFDIIYEARRRGLLVPFEEKQLKGASYDIRAGDHAVVVHSQEEGGYERVALKEQGYIDILPGQTVAIYGLERLGLPPDMKGRLSLRSYWAIKGLQYNGGIVDPGYTGLLFFNVTNSGDSTIRVSYGEGLVTTEFVRLDQPSQRIYNDGEPILDIPSERLPPLPVRSMPTLSILQERIEELQRRIVSLEQASTPGA
jgi:deoxycytidine triphosphate deaminase